MLRCDIHSGLSPEPQRECIGEGDWVSVVLHRDRRASAACVSDAVGSMYSPTLAYGTTWARDAITCTSDETGLRCVNRLGHGFFLSRELWRVF
ncbi:MAG TPA: DUF6636 domain-containing protein [Actinomycetota bacterium]|nr:DUF6636 domain-containing protein [Actinomycetota bacterium]